MCVVAVLPALADTSTLTFTAACGGTGTAGDGVVWTVTSDGIESTYDATKGIHYGTGSSAVQYLQLSTSGISGTITKVVVNASTASGVSATVSVTIGGNAFGGNPQLLSSTATNYTFTGSASGQIVVRVEKPESAVKALYVKSIAVTYGPVATPTYRDVTGIDGLKAQSAAILSYIDPVAALLFSALFLREPLSLPGIAGAVMIIGSAVVSEIRGPD